MNVVERRVRDGWLKQSGVPAEGFALSELDAPKEALGWVDSYCRGEITNGVGLAMYGPPGHGKTTIAEAICREVIERAPLEVLGFTPEIKTSRPVYFTYYVDYVDAQKTQWKLERLHQHDTDEYHEVTNVLEGVLGTAYHEEHRYRLVVLDDVGKEYHSGSGWAEGEFNALLRRRFRRGLSTILTTNVDLELWGATYGKAAASFVHEAFIPAEIVSPDGKDRRR